MKRMARWLSVPILVAGLATLTYAQEGKKNEEEFVREKPTISDALPDVVVYDSSGKEVPTSALRGHYTVLTFGCLT